MRPVALLAASLALASPAFAESQSSNSSSNCSNGLCTRSEPPRLWFWFALLLISLLVGLLQSFARRP